MLLGLAPQNESSAFKVPSLLGLIMAKDRNAKVLENKEALKKICNILDRALECRYIIEDEQLYALFLEDVYIQMDTALKRYMAMEIIMNK